ncbi:MAG: AbrB/MazE/SpoVT family DNA-binding domain-containing protein [Burkholderiales bacterium]
MKTQTIKIGDAQAVCIPPALLGELSLGDEVEISLEDGHLLIRPLRPSRPLQMPRAGWAEAAQRMAAAEDDALLDPELTGQSEFDQQEWQWESAGEG